MWKFLNRKYTEWREKSLYIRILLWAYKKQKAGFTWREIEDHFNLSTEMSSWVKNIFLTTGGDRKFFETIDPNETNRYMSLNEKGITAVLSHLNQRQTKWVSVLAIIISLIGLIFTIWSLYLTRTSIELATRPQIDLYLQASEDSESGEYILGIENNGTVPVWLISVKYSLTKISKQGCQENRIDVTCGGAGVMIPDALPNKEKNTVFSPSRDVIVPLIMSTSTAMINSLSVTLTYGREIDRNIYSRSEVFFVDGNKIYTLEQLRDIPAMWPYITSFRQFSADTTQGSGRLYWKQEK